MPEKKANDQEFLYLEMDQMLDKFRESLSAMDKINSTAQNTAKEIESLRGEVKAALQRISEIRVQVDEAAEVCKLNITCFKEVRGIMAGVSSLQPELEDFNENIKKIKNWGTFLELYKSTNTELVKMTTQLKSIDTLREALGDVKDGIKQVTQAEQAAIDYDVMKKIVALEKRISINEKKVRSEASGRRRWH